MVVQELPAEDARRAENGAGGSRRISLRGVQEETGNF